MIKDYFNINYNGNKFNNGDIIPEATDVKDFISYGNNKKPCLFKDINLNETFYNFYSLIDPRGFAPNGYRVATPNDWNHICYESKLEDTYSSELDQIECIEEDFVLDNDNVSNIEWIKTNFKIENKKNSLNIKPVGFISQWNGRVGINKQARFWTSKDRSSWDDFESSFWVGFNSEYVFLGAYDHIRNNYASKTEGLSVRLIKV